MQQALKLAERHGIPAWPLRMTCLQNLLLHSTDSTAAQSSLAEWILPTDSTYPAVQPTFLNVLERV